jgi:protein TonB
MSKIDLTSNEWRELVFQGKNKAYGAYVLREESAKRHNIAIVIITIVAIIGFLSPQLIKMVTPKEKEVNVDETSLSKLEDIKKEEKVEKIIEVEPPKEVINQVKFTPPVITEDSRVNEADEMKSQADLDKAPNISIIDVTGGSDKKVDPEEQVQQVTQEVVEEKVYSFVEQQPQFPGGEGELQAFVAKNMKYPAIALENRIQGKVIIQFVVGKTGKVSRVKVVRSLDPACDREAVRVAELIPDFIPGKQNGQNVAVTYTLPVSFKMAE